MSMNKFRNLLITAILITFSSCQSFESKLDELQVLSCLFGYMKATLKEAEEQNIKLSDADIEQIALDAKKTCLGLLD